MSEKNITISVPVVATRGVIVFPEQEIMIEVGRHKSMNAIDEAEKFFNGQVVLVSQKDILVDDPRQDELFEFGSLVNIKAVKRKQGFLRVTFTGLKRVKIDTLNDDGRMLFGAVTALEDIIGEENEEMALVRRITNEIEQVSVQNITIPTEIVNQLTMGVSASQLSDQFAQYFPLQLERKQELLEELSVNERLLMIIEEIQREHTLAQIENTINEKVKDRVEENQREYYLREKMRAIREELGDVGDVGEDSDEFREMIENNPYPEYVKEKAMEELRRYEMLPQASGESGVVRSYLEWLLKTPWWQQTEDIKDLNLVREKLDEDHFGLDKVKDRIMEYLAVKEMTGNLEAPIICLVGPPGVGKTSLAKSIADSLGREFVKASVGGVRDEAEIRGHRRTYLGSLPGRIIQGMKKAGVVNPVFLIDEIDKMASDYKGDPSSAMLEVLDPEQNKMFSDNYLEEPYDLSNVMFVATANYLGDIPEALRDRLEIIQLSSYTEEEKLNIAKEHLIPIQLESNGLKKSQFRMSDAQLRYVIRHYTREAGVRQLERVIASLCRKTVLAILKDGKKTITINKELITEWLGQIIFEYGQKEKKDQVGVVTGLAYTQFGGDVLPIEVTTYEGKGRLVVTGQLGDVMKESAEIAMGYVKSHARSLNIAPDFFEKHDVQVHVPEGAVPKDGPSAGVTFTTALISALTDNKVRANLAMTGEITLRGNVLPIGGLKEKSLAAHRVGINRIVIPKLNEKDLAEVPDVVKESVTFIPCETIEEVLKEALI
ncbi:endopeptidase La [Erysipelothrix rhusiopathiae]|uniref:endopeptidase La n=1 Tax=Erysipelothrix rhusiopathiae TaxID=1648 RepID=UPI000210B7D9|nr:endopeptidase La [Erysipelothrix rhusiopathiae]AGN24314.1 ATP-dependent protease La [Erysipelothrix rhusiopathiae SY1027]AMS10926.1 endopeptidase La [Erysipelothrix rhusiopathiae]AOO66802.1 endopeptidase La [Erysipelothrix rhusiopathiae]AWU41708.1 endopeptidase La [Erysipelothrix rhusiopathiae]MDE8283055.1 endopeptidase La [Erysipelothrix rhusiopathiae]